LEIPLGKNANFYLTSIGNPLFIEYNFHTIKDGVYYPRFFGCEKGKLLKIAE
jgi:hypothetical protein